MGTERLYRRRVRERAKREMMWTAAVAVLVIGLLADCVATGVETAAAETPVSVAVRDASHVNSVIRQQISSPVDATVCRAPDGLAANRASMTRSPTALVDVVLVLMPAAAPDVRLSATPRGPPSPLPLAARSGRELLHCLCVIRR